LKILAPLVVIGIIAVAVMTMLSGSSTSQVEIVSELPKVNSKSLQSTPTIMETNGLKHIIPLDKIKGGGPPKDGIPSIDDPKFAEAPDSQFVSDSDVVIGLEINGDTVEWNLMMLAGELTIIVAGPGRVSISHVVKKIPRYLQ